MTAAGLRVRVVELRDRKQLDFEQISELLNAEGEKTVTGKPWTKYNVSYVYYGRKGKRATKAAPKKSGRVPPPPQKATSKTVLARIAVLAKKHEYRWDDVAKAMTKEGHKTVTGVPWSGDLVGQLYRKRIAKKAPQRGGPVDEESARITREIVRMKKSEMDFAEIASHLNTVKLKTSMGGRWTRDNVRKRYAKEMGAQKTAKKPEGRPVIRTSPKAQAEEDLLNEALRRSLAPNPDNVHDTIRTFLRVMHAAGIRITKIVWLPTGEVEVERTVSDSFTINM